MNSSGNTQVIHLAAQDGECVSVVGDTYRIVMSGKQTGGAYATIDMFVPPRGGPGPHSHAEVQEAFYVVEGEIFVQSEAGSFTAKAGSFINIPLGGAVHCFHNASDEMAHLLCIVVPAGLDNFFLEIGKPVANGEFLPVPVMDEDEQQRLQSIAEKYGQKLFPPDYFGK